MVIMIYIQEYKAITRHFCGIFFRENFLPVASGELCIRDGKFVHPRREICASASGIKLLGQVWGIKYEKSRARFRPDAKY